MTEELRQADVLTDEELKRLFGWGEDIFGTANSDLKWRPKDVHFLIYEDGKPASHASILRHEIAVGGKPLMVAGLGGVVTHPEAQGKGYARRLVRHASEFFEREWEVEAGLLFCLKRMVTYYGALGWQLLPEKVIIDQPSGKIVSPLEVMVLPCRGQSWPNGEVELKSLPW